MEAPFDYQIFPVPADLQPWVSHLFVYARNQVGDNLVEFAPTDGYPGLLCRQSLPESILRITPSGLAVLPHLSLQKGIGTGSWFRLQGKVQLLGARLRQQTLYHLIQESPENLPDFHAWETQRHITGITDLIQLLRNKLGSIYQYNFAFEELTGQLPLNFRLRDLGSEKEKWLERQWKRYQAVTPSEWRSGRRFARAYIDFRQSSDFHHSDYGYYDRSHFERDFRYFTGYSQKEFKALTLVDVSAYFHSQISRQD